MTYHTRNLVPEEARLIAEAKARRARMGNLTLVRPVFIPRPVVFEPEKKRSRVKPIVRDGAPYLPVVVKRIIIAVAAHFDVDPHDILSDRRSSSIVIPRHVAVWMTKQIRKESLPQIGVWFDRDHSTILYAVRKISRMAVEDCDFALRIAGLMSDIGPGLMRGGM